MDICLLLKILAKISEEKSLRIPKGRYISPEKKAVNY